jgi:hypothetical protein
MGAALMTARSRLGSGRSETANRARAIEMTAIAEKAAGLLAKVRAATLPVPTILRFAADGQQSANENTGFTPDRCYFLLTVHEIFLKKGRSWWSGYDPSVYVNADFIYDRNRLSVPALVGPESFKAKQELPHGFLINDITVVGPHPYRGDNIGITVVLYRIKTADYARRTLKLAENISSAVGVPADIPSLTKVGSTILDAFETLIDMQDSEPVVGHRIELSRLDGGLVPTYFALLPGNEISAEDLRVSERRLTYRNGDPVRETDYILYSILRLPRRDQIRTLKFYDMLDTMDTAALAGDDDSWQRAKSTLIAVYQEMLKCPDLIGEQVNELFQAYKERLVENRRRSKEVGLMGPGEQKAAPLAVQANAAIAEINEIQ